MDVSPQTTGARKPPLAVGPPAVHNVNSGAVAKAQNHDFGTEQWFSATTAKKIEDIFPRSFLWFSKKTALRLARALVASVPQLLSPESAHILSSLEAAFRSAAEEDGDEPQDETYHDWVLLPQSSPENELESAMHTDTTQEPPREWERLQTKRLDLMDQRVRVREARGLLRRARTAMRDKDIEFERTLRKIFASDTKYGFKEKEDYEHLQQSREAVRTQEDAYDVLEEKLLSAEYEVRQLEDKIYGMPVADLSQQNEPGEEEGMYVGRFSPQPPARDSLDSPNASEGRQHLAVPWHSAKDRLKRTKKQLKKLGRKMARLDKDAKVITQAMTLPENLSARVQQEQREQLHDISERRSDVAIDIMLLEEDAVVLEDIVFHQQDYLFSLDQFTSPQQTLSSHAESLFDPIDLSNDDDLDLNVLDKPPPRHLAFRDLRTKSISEAARQSLWSDISTVSGFIGAWLLQIVCASQFSVLLLRATISHRLPAMKPLRQERKAAQFWFSDGSERWYDTGILQDVRSMDPLSSTGLTRSTNIIWESRLLSSRDSFGTDGDTIANYRSHTPILVTSSTDSNAKLFGSRRCVSETTGAPKNAPYDEEMQYEHCQKTAQQQHPSKSALGTRPKAIRYLLHMWNHPPLA